jgi:hypothetical protein
MFSGDRAAIAAVFKSRDGIARDLRVLLSAALRRWGTLHFIIFRNWLLEPQNLLDLSPYRRMSISGTAFSGRKPMSGRFSARLDSFHGQSVQCLAGSSCKRELYEYFFPSRLSKFDCS